MDDAFLCYLILANQYANTLVLH